MRLFKLALPALLLLGASFCYAKECLPPPVSSEAQAACLAENFVEKRKYSWETGYRVKDANNYWLVSYYPISSHIRGGAGDLKVEKTSGKVILVRGYR